jgi:coproporphyrinogen III oxidase-like Fe-S oxidoreductase
MGFPAKQRRLVFQLAVSSGTGSGTHFALFAALEPHTPLGQMVERQEISLLDEDLELEMYRHSQEILSQAGYHQYEISNLHGPVMSAAITCCIGTAASTWVWSRGGLFHRQPTGKKY